MHRTIEITVSPSTTGQLAGQLAAIEEVVRLSVHPGASFKPPGDVLVVHVLNQGANKVLRVADAARRDGPVSIATAELTSIIDPAHAGAVDADVDEAVWEEMETGLRHQGRVTQNFLVLMGLGGGIAAAGLVSEPVPQTVALIASSVVAPAFEPLVRIPLGVVLGRWNAVRRGVLSAGIGYLVLMLGAAAMYLALHASGSIAKDDFLLSPEVERVAHPTLVDGLTSACAAVAGVVMVAAYRRSEIAGPLIALMLMPAAATVGLGVATGEGGVAWDGLVRLGLDAALIVVLGAIVFGVKQALVHRRSSIA